MAFLNDFTILVILSNFSHLKNENNYMEGTPAISAFSSMHVTLAYYLFVWVLFFSILKGMNSSL